MKKVRTDPQRFHVGGLVHVNSLIRSRCSDKVGRIIAVQVSRYERTLDKYLVAFDEHSPETFWDIQLDAVSVEAPPAPVQS